MNVNDPAHLTEELLERLLASDDIETQRLLRLAGVSELDAGSGATRSSFGACDRGVTASPRMTSCTA